MFDRKLSSKVSRAVFFDEFNQIDIYIEDTAKGYKKLFLMLMKKVFMGKYKINNVFPLGGRNEVLNSCKKDQSPRKKSRVYIIDGDLHLLSGEIENTNLKGLYVLPRYCIENHLLCGKSFLQIMDEEDPERSNEYLNREFNYNGWIQSITTSLLDLFIEYGIAKSIAPHIQTVSFGYKGLISNGTGEVDALKVTNRIESLRHDIINFSGYESYINKKVEIQKLVTYDENSLLTYVSGKDILMPLLMIRLKKTVKIQATNLAIKFRIINLMQVDSFANLSYKVHSD